jgi:hypothetical protein
MSRLAWWGWCLTTWFLVANGFLEFPWNLGLLDLTVLLWLWSDNKRTKAVLISDCKDSLRSSRLSLNRFTAVSSAISGHRRVDD